MVEWDDEYLRELVPVADVPAEVRRLTGDRTKPHKATVFRWIHRGLRGQCLPAVKFAGRTHVMRGRLIEFLMGQGVGGHVDESGSQDDVAGPSLGDTATSPSAAAAQLQAEILRLQANGQARGRLPKWFQQQRRRRAKLVCPWGYYPRISRSAVSFCVGCVMGNRGMMQKTLQIMAVLLLLASVLVVGHIDSWEMAVQWGVMLVLILVLVLASFK